MSDTKLDEYSLKFHALFEVICQRARNEVPSQIEAGYNPTDIMLAYARTVGFFLGFVVDNEVPKARERVLELISFGEDDAKHILSK